MSLYNTNIARSIRKNIFRFRRRETSVGIVHDSRYEIKRIGGPFSTRCPKTSRWDNFTETLVKWESTESGSKGDFSTVNYGFKTNPKTVTLEIPANIRKNSFCSGKFINETNFVLLDFRTNVSLMMITIWSFRKSGIR